MPFLSASSGFFFEDYSERDYREIDRWFLKTGNDSKKFKQFRWHNRFSKNSKTTQRSNTQFFQSSCEVISLKVITAVLTSASLKASTPLSFSKTGRRTVYPPLLHLMIKKIHITVTWKLIRCGGPTKEYRGGHKEKYPQGSSLTNAMW